MNTEYAVIIRADVGELALEVNKHIKDNWVPLGGIAISNWTSDSGDCLSEYAQAMVKNTLPPDYQSITCS